MIGENVSLDKNLKIEQNTIIKDNVAIGEDVVIFPMVYTNENAEIGTRLGVTE